MHEGNIIVVGSEQLEVAAACNGLSMLISLAATVVAFILLTPMAPGRRLTLFLSIVPIGLACNVIRIATTAWCYDRYGSKVGGPWAHDIAGWLMMPLAIAMVMAELWLLSWLIADEPTLTSPIRSPAPRKSRS
jgi:exosortase/archaeosortase family protein